MNRTIIRIVSLFLIPCLLGTDPAWAFVSSLDRGHTSSLSLSSTPQFLTRAFTAQALEPFEVAAWRTSRPSIGLYNLLAWAHRHRTALLHWSGIGLLTFVLQYTSLHHHGAGNLLPLAIGTIAGSTPSGESPNRFQLVGNRYREIVLTKSAFPPNTWRYLSVFRGGTEIAHLYFDQVGNHIHFRPPEWKSGCALESDQELQNILAEAASSLGCIAPYVIATGFDGISELPFRGLNAERLDGDSLQYQFNQTLISVIQTRRLSSEDSIRLQAPKSWSRVPQSQINDHESPEAPTHSKKGNLTEQFRESLRHFLPHPRETWYARYIYGGAWAIYGVVLVLAFSHGIGALLYVIGASLPLLMSGAVSSYRTALRKQTDPLTGLGTRSSLDLEYETSRINRMFERAKRTLAAESAGLDSSTESTSTNLPRLFDMSRPPDELSVVLFDLDFFKTINDSYGHPAGDLVLKTVGELLQELTRPEDIAVRWGGEEFLIFVAGNQETANQVAQRIRDSLRGLSLVYEDNTYSIKRNHTFGRSIHVSIGIATIASTDNDVDALIARADQALYHAKRTGRNKISVYERDVSGPSEPQTQPSRARDSFVAAALVGIALTLNHHLPFGYDALYYVLAQAIALRISEYVLRGIVIQVDETGRIVWNKRFTTFAKNGRRTEVRGKLYRTLRYLYVFTEVTHEVTHIIAQHYLHPLDRAVQRCIPGEWGKMLRYIYHEVLGHGVQLTIALAIVYFSGRPWLVWAPYVLVAMVSLVIWGVEQGPAFIQAVQNHPWLISSRARVAHHLNMWTNRIRRLSRMKRIIATLVMIVLFAVPLIGKLFSGPPKSSHSPDPSIAILRKIAEQQQRDIRAIHGFHNPTQNMFADRLAATPAPITPQAWFNNIGDASIPSTAGALLKIQKDPTVAQRYARVGIHPADLFHTQPLSGSLIQGAMNDVVARTKNPSSAAAREEKNNLLALALTLLQREDPTYSAIGLGTYWEWGPFQLKSHRSQNNLYIELGRLLYPLRPSQRARDYDPDTRHMLMGGLLLIEMNRDAILNRYPWLNNPEHRDAFIQIQILAYNVGTSVLFGGLDYLLDQYPNFRDHFTFEAFRTHVNASRRGLHRVLTPQQVANLLNGFLYTDSAYAYYRLWLDVRKAGRDIHLRTPQNKSISSAA